MKTNLLRVALFTPGPDGMQGLPLLLWGLPGVAKTAIIKQLAREYNLPLEVLSPACRGEGAFGVTPVPEGGYMSYPPPDWVKKFEATGRGIVFVDEINLAAQHFAGALLGLLQDHVVGSYKLPPGVRVMAAANPIDIAAASGGWDLSAPAANRIGHLDWPPPTIGEWSAWLLEQGIGERATSAEGIENTVDDAWPRAWGTARGIVTGFLSARSTFLHAMPKTGGEELSRAWPSPRSWELAARAIAGATIFELSPAEREELVAAFVGPGAAGELATWYEQASLPDSTKLLDGEVEWHFQPARLDVAVAVFSSAAQVCVGTAPGSLRTARAEAMWALLAQASAAAPDLIVPPARVLVQARLFPRAAKVLSSLHKVLIEAKITFESDRQTEAA